MKDKGIFLKIIPESSSGVKSFYFSSLKLKFFKFILIFFGVLLTAILIFSFWMVGNFARMKMLEYEANKVKIQEKKITELEKKLQKFILFAQKVEKLLTVPEEKEINVEKLNLVYSDTFAIRGNSEKNIFIFELPVKGIISNFYSVLHPGVDIAAASGTPIRAPCDGLVVQKGMDENYGLYIWIKHEGGIKTFYAHLKEIDVRKGEWVKKGEIIGKVGSSGKSTGPHLHFEIWKEGFPLNPLNFTSYPYFALKYKSKY